MIATSFLLNFSYCAAQLYDSSLQVRLGVTAGMAMVVKAFPGKGQKHHTKHNFFFPDCYEATYTFYLGDMGHVSAQVHTQYPDKFLVSLNSRACCCKSLVQFTEALTLKSNQRPNTFSLPISVRICVGQKHSPLSSG